MQDAIYYKIIQRRNKYRNPKNITSIPCDFIYKQEEYIGAQDYILNLQRLNINYTYPTHALYPTDFYKMKEPPLFVEYMGDPLWTSFAMLSVVGSREIEDATISWLNYHLAEFLNNCQQYVGIVSGGARGVDQLAHQIAIKNNRPTIFVLPTGLLDLYPSNLEIFKKNLGSAPVCFLTEFEINQKIHKSNFYFRNRLIAALGQFTFVAQASLKSGSLLTVHHSLEIGKPVVTLPAHPEMHRFKGNIQLLQEGAYLINQYRDLLDFWNTETRPNSRLV